MASRHPHGRSWGHEEFDEASFEAALFTKGLPDPDLLIRTSDEFRLSNFMLWQVAYTELHIASVLWPDFSREDLFRRANQ